MSPSVRSTMPRTTSPSFCQSSLKTVSPSVVSWRARRSCNDLRDRPLRLVTGESKSVMCHGETSSCVQYRRPRALRRLKPPERLFGRPNNCSVQFLAMSPSCFGQQKQRLTSLHSSGAVNEPPRCISLETATGQPTQWPCSSVKSVSGTECAI